LRKTAFVSGLEVGYGRPDAAQEPLARFGQRNRTTRRASKPRNAGLSAEGDTPGVRAAALPGDRDTTFSADQLARDIDEFLSIPHAIQDALLSALQQPKLHLCSSASKEKQRGKTQTGKRRPGSVADRTRLHGPELRLRTGD
jgi:hypothetical protein